MFDLLSHAGCCLVRGTLARGREVLVEVCQRLDAADVLFSAGVIGAGKEAIAQALSQLRVVCVNGPYSVLLGDDAYTALAETSDHGYPVLERVHRLVTGETLWAPASTGTFVLSTRGGDFQLHIGQDVSIGYSSHNETVVRLYLEETIAFLLLTREAAVGLAPGKGPC
jgi:uncharacterized linocin/CFP29 family protein